MKCLQVTPDPERGRPNQANQARRDPQGAPRPTPPSSNNKKPKSKPKSKPKQRSGPQISKQLKKTSWLPEFSKAFSVRKMKSKNKTEKTKTAKGPRVVKTKSTKTAAPIPVPIVSADEQTDTVGTTTVASATLNQSKRDTTGEVRPSFRQIDKMRSCRTRRRWAPRRRTCRMYRRVRGRCVFFLLQNT